MTDADMRNDADADYDTRPHLDSRLAASAKRATKRRAQLALRLAIGAIGFLTRSRGPRPPLRAGDPSIRRILVVRVDLLGDAVLSLPAVRALRRAYPDASVDVLVTRGAAGILAGETCDIRRVIAYDPHVFRSPRDLLRPDTWRDAWAMLGQLRATPYDLAISISGDIGSIVTRLTGAKRRVGYQAEAYAFLLTDTLPGGRYRKHQHEVRYVLALAERAGGIVLPEDAQPRLHVRAEAAAWAADTLYAARHSRSRGGPIVAIHAGARNGQAKRWPTGHIAVLSDRLAAEMDALVVLTGAPNEAALADAVMANCRAQPLNLVGMTSLPQLVALLSASALVITGDSGPMHIACAVGTPVVALHGPTDPALSGPTAPGALVLRHALWCSPCYDASATAECRFSNPVCMKAITPGQVFAAARHQLIRQQRSGRPQEGAARYVPTGSLL